MGRNVAFWDNELVSTFCDLCIQEVDAGSRPGSHFTRAGWDNLVKNFNKATGKEYTKVQLKNKWDSLKANWKLWKDLTGKETGLGWNISKKTVDASQEWWNTKLQVFPNARKFQKEGIDPEMREKLDRMFVNITASGIRNWAASSGTMYVEKPLPSEASNSNIGDDETNPFETTGDSQDTEQREASVERKGKRVRGKVGGAARLSTQIDRLVNVVESKKNDNTSMNYVLEVLKKRREDSNGFSMSDVIDVLKALPGMKSDSELYMFSLSLLKKQENRDVLAAMKEKGEEPHMILKWLEYEKKNS